MRKWDYSNIPGLTYTANKSDDNLDRAIERKANEVAIKIAGEIKEAFNLERTKVNAIEQWYYADVYRITGIRHEKDSENWGE